MKVNQISCSVVANTKCREKTKHPHLDFIHKHKQGKLELLQTTTFSIHKHQL